MPARKKYSFETLKLAALTELSNRPVEEWIEASLNYQSIRQRLQERQSGESDATDWSKKSSVSTAVDTAYNQAVKGAEPAEKQQRWLARELAIMFELVDLRLRTSATAVAPLARLLERARAEPGLVWPDGIRETAEEVFANALQAIDEETGMRRSDVLLFRSAENSGIKIPLDDLRRSGVAHQIKNYHRLWENLLEAYGRKLKGSPDVSSIEDLLKLIGAFEDGLLARATGAPDPEAQYHGASFALGTEAILDGVTVKND